MTFLIFLRVYDQKIYHLTKNITEITEITEITYKLMGKILYLILEHQVHKIYLYIIYQGFIKDSTGNEFFHHIRQFFYQFIFGNKSLNNI